MFNYWVISPTLTVDLFWRFIQGLPRIVFTLQRNLGKGLNFLSFFIHPWTSESQSCAAGLAVKLGLLLLFVYVVKRIKPAVP